MKKLLAPAAVLLVLAGGVAYAESGYGTYNTNATNCERDLNAMYDFYEANIANTPNPQLTLETGIYTSRTTGISETYAALLHRQALYAANRC
jgi:hypothetical protein